MAGADRSSVGSVPKKIRETCAHCKKEVVSKVQCKKCDAFFHPACLRQAGAQRNAICVHSEEIVHQVTSKPESQDIAHLETIINKMLRRIERLEESEGELKKKIESLEEIVENSKPGKKGKQTKTGKTSVSSNSKSGNTARGQVNPVLPNELPNNSAGSNIELGSNDSLKDDEVFEVEVDAVDSIDAVSDVNNTGKTLSLTLPENKNKNTENQEVLPENSVNLPSERMDIAKKSPHEGQSEWKTVFRKKKLKADPKIRPNAIKGNKENYTGLRVAKKANFIWLFVSGFDTETNPDEIKSYLEENGVSAMICEQLKTKTEHKYSSFKVQGIRLPKSSWLIAFVVSRFCGLFKKKITYLGDFLKKRNMEEEDDLGGGSSEKRFKPNKDENNGISPLTLIDSGIKRNEKIPNLYSPTDKGPFVVFIESTDKSGNNIGRFNDLKIAKDIFNLKLTNIKNINNKGLNRLSIEFDEYKAANEFIENTFLKDKGYSIFVPYNFVTCKGIVRQVHKDIPLNELTDAISSPFEVLDIVRLNRKILSNDNDNKTQKGTTLNIVRLFRQLKIRKKHKEDTTELPIVKLFYSLIPAFPMYKVTKI
ncbi:unnamed protein product [Ceutorhynchus assimilis]|uniref:Uncharacterized protein n=1 Tax=Ceutorhynchus assimilis TaxID=467358 RepID=A0A9N9MFE2_9CUCU|nr:unnamed protein product [Ceutorhynchus assimilis]